MRSIVAPALGIAHGAFFAAHASAFLEQYNNNRMSVAGASNERKRRRNGDRQQDNDNQVLCQHPDELLRNNHIKVQYLEYLKTTCGMHGLYELLYTCVSALAHRRQQLSQQVQESDDDDNDDDDDDDEEDHVEIMAAV